MQAGCFRGAESGDMSSVDSLNLILGRMAGDTYILNAAAGAGMGGGTQWG